MNKTVVIPAAGIGSRLGAFTKNYSKAMCTLGPMPVISYIIEEFSNDDEIIILLGYKGDLLRQVVNICHPEKNIKFVEVDNYVGEGSGLGYSLSCAKDLLQKPFIFWSCDTILPSMNLGGMNYEYDWMIGCADNQDMPFEEYRHIEIKYNKSLNDNCVTSILPKDSLKSQYAYNYVGVSYVKHYKEFWEAFDKNKEVFVASGEVCGFLNIAAKHTIKGYVNNDWIDCGNRKIFEKAKQLASSKMVEAVLEKPDESIWFINGKVIKFHIDEKFIADRIKRYHLLCEKQIKNGIVMPKLLKHDKNVYSYKRADGIIASSLVTPVMLKDILERFLDVEYIDLNDAEKENIYRDFYYDKTISRINKYCKEYEDIDRECTVNGLKCMSATEIMNKVNWKEISKRGIFTHNYHGDFHLENILVNDNKYVILDWRQNFGKTYVGDIYYDIAKMWHSLIVNHDMVRQNLFSVETEANNNIRIDIHRTLIDTQCERYLVDYINGSEYDIVQSEFLTAVIFLNIAACHVYPYSRFLFYLGKLMINEFYNKYKDTNFFTNA